MAFLYTTTAIPNESSIVRGNVAYVGGHWDMNDLTTAQAIVTGGSDVLAAYCNSDSVTTMPSLVPNQNAAASAANGTIKIQGQSANASGTWFAIVRVTGTN